MSTSPVFSSYQFVAAADFNSGTTSALTGIHDTNARLHTFGIVSSGSAAISVSGLVATAVLSAPFSVLFSSGVLASAHGTNTNADTQTYTADFTPLVPTSTPIVAYLVASAVTIQQNPYTIVGPPPGHPSYNPNFVPYTAYKNNVDSLAVVATTTPPDNLTTFEIGRTTLTVGQSTLPSLDRTHQTIASSLIAPNVFMTITTTQAVIVPPGCTACEIPGFWAGGGSGGGASNVGSIGSGGGAGQFFCGQITGLVAGQVVAATLPAAPAGGAPGANGAAGSTASFGSYVSLAGGGAGIGATSAIASTAGAPGTGGVISGATGIILTGDGGGTGYVAGSAYIGGSSGGAHGRGGIYGTSNSNTSQPGFDGGAPGRGGSGGIAGGNGGAGGPALLLLIFRQD